MAKQGLTVQDVLKEKIDVRELLDSLGFDEESLDSASMNQAKLFDKAARLYAQALRRKAETKAAAEAMNAQAYIEARRYCEEKEMKFTEASLKAAVTRQKPVIKAEEEAREAEQESDYLKLLVESFRQRGNQLRLTGDLLMHVSRQRLSLIGSQASQEEVDEMLKQKYPGSMGSSQPSGRTTTKKKTTRKRSK